MECLATPSMLRFGDDKQPSVRGLPGKVVQLDGLETEPVLFMRGEDDELLKTGCQVLVWAWSKPVTCAKGGAWIAQPSRQDVALTRYFKDLHLSTSGIFSPAREALEEVVTGKDLTRSVDKTSSDKCSDVSFGSISECDEIDLDKSLTPTFQ